MTPEERLLLLRVVRRAHADGWVRCLSYGSTERRGHMWVGADHRIVTWERCCGALTGPGFGECSPDSLGRALTWLAAADVLPTELSPAYRDGYAAGEAAGWKNALKLAGDLDHARRVARTAAAVLTPDAPEVT